MAIWGRSFLELCVIASLVLAADGARGVDCNGNLIDDAEDLLPTTYGLGQAMEIVTGRGPATAVVAALLDGDGLADLAVARTGETGIEILRNVGTGAVEPLGFLPLVTAPLALLAVDVDGDHDSDLAALLGSSIQIAWNDGAGSFPAADTVPIDPSGNTPAFVAGDLSGDGLPDFLVSNGVLPAATIVSREPGGGFSSRSVALPHKAWTAALADLDGDSDLDAVTASAAVLIGGILQSRGSVSLLINRGGGDFEARPVIAMQNTESFIVNPRYVALSDVDQDGDVDMLVVTANYSTYTTATLWILASDGGGSFDEGLADRQLRVDPAAALVGDLEGDGDPDAVVLPWSRQAHVYLNREGRFPYSPVRAALEGIPSTGSLADDMDGDGLLDVVTANFLPRGTLSIIPGRLASASRDCDQDGIPDECWGSDCSVGAVLPECASDCNGDGFSDACQISRGTVKDCNANGIPDTCEPDLLIDVDADGVPERCADLSFRITFEATSVDEPKPGGTGRAEASVFLQTRGLLPGEPGAQGWTLFVASTRCDTVAATTIGTDVGEILEAPGNHGFEVTELLSCTCPNGQHGATTSVVLSLNQPVTLEPAQRWEVLRLTVEQGPESNCDRCGIGLRGFDDCNQCHRGQPIENVVLFEGRSQRPISDGVSIRFCSPSFRRGDANADGSFDIADPIFTLGSNFLWVGGGPPCDRAADADGNGSVNITDAVRMLNVLFLGLGTIPPPAPAGPCGPEPDELSTTLSCESYDACG